MSIAFYASSPDFKVPESCWESRFGVSIVVAADGRGRLLVSRREGNAFKHSTTPLQSKVRPANQSSLGVELVQFRDPCRLHDGQASIPCSTQEAHNACDDFHCELLDDNDSGDYELKLYPSVGGHCFCFEDGEEEITSPSDLVLTTPNCDELGHYMLRQQEASGRVASTEDIEFAVANEVAAWDAILASPTLTPGLVVRTRWVIKAASEEATRLNKGLNGTVKEVDEDGDALIDFGNGIGKQWIDAQDFKKLAPVS